MEGFLRAAPVLGIALALALGGLDAGQARGAPLAVAAIGAAGARETGIRRVGACREDCADCDDCPTEIDIAPAYPADDPIAREIRRFGPAPLDPCEAGRIVTRGRRATHDADSCGIRCWYWRLRHGYCGPGCDYYRYRMYHYGSEAGYRHPRAACPS